MLQPAVRSTVRGAAGDQFDARNLGAIGNGVADDSTAFLAAAAAYDARCTSLGAQYPNAAQTGGLRVPPCRIKASGAAVGGVGTGWEITGSGASSQLEGVQVNLIGTQGRARDFTLMGSGAVGLSLSGNTPRNRRASRIWIRDKTLGVSVSGVAAFDNLNDLNIEKCTTGLRVFGGHAGLNVIDSEIVSCTGNGMEILNNGEFKFLNSRVLNSAGYNCYISGHSRAPHVESYWANATLTVAQRNRIMNILSAEVSPLSATQTRFHTSPLWSLSSVVNRGGRFLQSLATPGAWDARVIIGNATLPLLGTEQVTSILAGGVELLGSAVTYASAPTRAGYAIALAAAVNARTGTTGYTAAASGASVYITAADGAAAQWRTLTVTSSIAWLAYTTNYVSLVLSSASDIVLGEDVDIQGTGIDGYTGFAEVVHVASTTEIGVELDFTSTATGTVCRPNRLQAETRAITMVCSVTGYNNTSASATAAASNWFDVDIPFTATTTGTATLPNWDLVIDARDSAPRVRDVLWQGGNINYTLIKSGYNITFNGTRLKAQFFIEPKAKPEKRSNRINIQVPSLNGRDEDTWSDVTPGGAVTGWTICGGRDDGINGERPGLARIALASPSKATAAVNGTGVMNEIGAEETGIYYKIGTTKYPVTSARFPLLGANASVISGAGTSGIEVVANTGRPLIRTVAPTATRADLELTSRGTDNTTATGSSIMLSPSGVRTFLAQWASAPSQSHLLARNGVGLVGPTLEVAATDGTTIARLNLAALGAAPVSVGNPLQLATYTLAGLPSAADHVRSWAWCSNLSGGAAPVYSDGTNWRNLAGVIAS